MLTGVGNMLEDRWGANHVGTQTRLPTGEDVLNCSSGSDHLLERSPDSVRPKLADVVLGRPTGVVCDERQRLALGSERRDCLWRSRGDEISDPHAAVEVEHDMVVGAEQGGEGHAPLSRSA